MTHRIAIGCDHAGVSLKQFLKEHLQDQGHEVTDVGAHSEASVDYPDFAHVVAEKVASGSADRGILVCGTGVGMAMTANRTPGVRCVNTSDLFTVEMSRGHNDANVLAIGERVVGIGLARQLVDVFLKTDFEGGRHSHRVAKIEPQ